ncbi:septum site-determining protein MinC [Clostridium cylindrosporum]|uniref:Probable septum site-determining protein MinC n=1 Tax=Clostridium cylindrosporum DSM 605 TaxID=1121307 RepID=A0A0J8D6R7_CLOCY|nr:septum site-determining protein MinC [Clostridium cylindrosporum]KMT21542.1 putative septum site-determining protein MinC [Clostridium cylindrosporum DSM 605]
MSNVTIKGSKNGIIIYINSNDFQLVKQDIIEKIERGKNFFIGSEIWITNGEANLSYEDLRSIRDSLKEQYNINADIKKESKVEEPEEKIFQGIYEGRTKFYKSTIRSGQKVNYDGNIIIIGDVNSGAEVMAAGNIIVLGVLRGIAHAGATGNKKAIVAAYSLKPTQLRIASLITRAPDDEKYSKTNIPEVAKIKDDIIIIEPYLPNKYF